MRDSDSESQLHAPEHNVIYASQWNDHINLCVIKGTYSTGAALQR